MHKTILTAAFFLPLFLLAGCPTKDAMPDEPDAGDAGVPSPDAAPPTDDAGPTTGTKPLAYGCSANAECASGFCVDGVCCDSACDQQCAACNNPGAAGHCAGQLSGDDTQAAAPCTGARTCGVDIKSPTLASCKLRNQQRCTAPADCASGTCSTYYEDLDRDTYGSGNAIKLCENAGAAAPPGYSRVSGDCCDRDISTNPAATMYFSAANVCGSWDFNCSGKIEVSPTGYSSGSCGSYVETCDGCQQLITCR
jgi:hypothetical protein